MHSTPNAVSKKPSEFSADELEYELFRQFLEAKSKGYAYYFILTFNLRSSVICTPSLYPESF